MKNKEIINEINLRFNAENIYNESVNDVIAYFQENMKIFSDVTPIYKLLPNGKTYKFYRQLHIGVQDKHNGLYSVQLHDKSVYFKHEKNHVDIELYIFFYNIPSKMVTCSFTIKNNVQIEGNSMNTRSSENIIKTSILSHEFELTKNERQSYSSFFVKIFDNVKNAVESLQNKFNAHID